LSARKILKALASLRIAVFVLIALGSLTAWGTFVEAAYGESNAAAKIVYHSVWMYSVMGLLATNLIAVMIDRWPWKERHAGFVLAHIGILILMTGSIITSYLGVDGSMSFGIGESSRYVTVNNTDLTVYTSLDGSSFRKIYDREVDFFSDRPSEKKPIVVELPTGQVKIVDYIPYAFVEEKIVQTDDVKAGSAIRFQLQNQNVNMTDWLMQPGPGREIAKDLGPARILIAGPVEKGAHYPNIDNRNMLVLRPSEDGQYLSYEIHTARTPGKVKTGRAEAGSTIETGWMGMVLRVIKFFPKAKQEVSFKENPRFTPLTTAAFKVVYTENGKKPQEQWTSANSMLKFFSDQAVYVVAYGNRRIDINVDLRLQQFHVGRYQGTMRAASYESVVDVPELGSRVISMNEPLKYKGFTFYQASFSEDERGRPNTSVLSVNRDPGRWVKYLGCLLIVSGTIHLFYFKRRAARAANPTK
jgi:hypothetical protein